MKSKISSPQSSLYEPQEIFADYRLMYCVPGVKRATVNYLSAQWDREIMVAFRRKMKVQLTRSPLMPGVPHSPLSP